MSIAREGGETAGGAGVEGQVAVRLASGEVMECDAVVIATEEPAARAILGEGVAPGGDEVSGADVLGPPRQRVGSTVVYYGFEGAPPVEEPLLVLNADAALDGQTVNTLCFPSAVSPAYAPPGCSLASVSVVGEVELPEAALEARVREQLAGWFGDAEIEGWCYLRSYVVPYAQPSQSPPTSGARAGGGFGGPTRLARGLYVCGDHRSTPSLNGALRSGREAAAALLDDFGAS